MSKAQAQKCTGPFSGLRLTVAIDAKGPWQFRGTRRAECKQSRLRRTGGGENRSLQSGMEVATKLSRALGCGGGVQGVQRVIGMPSTGSPLLPSTVTFATNSGGALNFAHRIFRPGSKSLL